MTLSPTFGWPPGGTASVPVVDSDGDVPLPDPDVRAASAYWIDGKLRVKLSDGTMVDVGPSAAPAGITARAVLGVKSALPDPPQVTYQLGDIVVDVAQSAITYHYTISCNVAVDDDNSAVLVTLQGGSPLTAASVSLLGGGLVRVAGQVLEVDGEGGITISATSVDFWLVIY